MEQLQLNFDPSEFTSEEAAVWGCLRDRRGKGREIIGTRIAEITGIEYDRVRAIIAHLVSHHDRLIGSNASGYYIPVTREEIAEVTKSLRHRGITILVRAARLQKTSLVEIWNQTYLEYTHAADGR